MKPYDLLRLDDAMWEVDGVYLGGLNQESVIECIRLDARPGHGKLAIPELMLRRAIASGLIAHYVCQKEELPKQ
jgi:hypothetical protein